jgi:hypothetical protein
MLSLPSEACSCSPDKDVLGHGPDAAAAGQPEIYEVQSQEGLIMSHVSVAVRESSQNPDPSWTARRGSQPEIAEREPPKPPPDFPEPPADIPWRELFPGEWNQHRRAIIEIALPYLATVLRDSRLAALTPRAKVEEAVKRVDQNQKRFWGAYDVFTRRRTVVDSILSHCFDTLWQHIAAG